jgi:hypothetical protein
MLEKPFTEEQGPSEVSGSSENQEPEYTFEGFTVEFSEKVMLTSSVPGRSALAKGQSASHAFVLEPKKESHDELTRV